MFFFEEAMRIPTDKNKKEKKALIYK